jgi:hypothetical protein
MSRRDAMQEREERWIGLNGSMTRRPDRAERRRKGPDLDVAMPRRAGSGQNILGGPFDAAGL